MNVEDEFQRQMRIGSNHDEVRRQHLANFIFWFGSLSAIVIGGTIVGIVLANNGYYQPMWHP